MSLQPISLFKKKKIPIVSGSDRFVEENQDSPSERSAERVVDAGIEGKPREELDAVWSLCLPVAMRARSLVAMTAVVMAAALGNKQKKETSIHLELLCGGDRMNTLRRKGGISSLIKTLHFTLKGSRL